MFHIVLLSIGIPFIVTAPATYIYEFMQHDGEFLLLIEYVFHRFIGLHLSRFEAMMVGTFEEKPAFTLVICGKCSLLHF